MRRTLRKIKFKLKNRRLGHGSVFRSANRRSAGPVWGQNGINWNHLKKTLLSQNGLKFAALTLLSFAGLMSAVFGYYAKDLPDPNKINAREIKQTTKIMDRHGKVLYQVYGDVKRTLIPFDQIPKNCKNATIVKEDRDFYKHHGFVPRSFVRAFTSTLGHFVGLGKVEGGSTITQQLVKNVLLTPEQTIVRKIKELILAVEIEQLYKKDDILRIYLNERYKKMSVLDFLELISKTTVNQLMAHETFRKRLESGSLGDHELQYPILQGYDSVALKADIELGAVEQKFNLLMGRQLQKDFSQTPQDVLMLPYLTGLDGKEKMSKSLGNYIALNDKPDVMYGKVMSIPDSLIAEYAELLTNWPLEKVKTLSKISGENARKTKAELAAAIVEKFYSKKVAVDAGKSFVKVFKNKELPDEIPIYKTKKTKASLITLMEQSKVVSSKSEARRMIEQGAVKVNGIKIDDINEEIAVSGGEIIQVGKRKFIKIAV